MHGQQDIGGQTMFQKSILAMGAMAAIGAAILTTPAKAGIFGLFDGSSGSGFVTGPAPSRVGGHVVADPYAARWLGAPGWQRPQRAVVSPWARADDAMVGPGRHVVCALEPRYDRRERYVGSRQVCWSEAR